MKRFIIFFLISFVFLSLAPRALADVPPFSGPVNFNSSCQENNDVRECYDFISGPDTANYQTYKSDLFANISQAWGGPDSHVTIEECFAWETSVLWPPSTSVQCWTAVGPAIAIGGATFNNTGEMNPYNGAVKYVATHIRIEQARVVYSIGVSGRRVSVESFTATPANASAGQPVMLSWAVSNTNSGTVTIDGVSHPAQGSMLVTPLQTTTYTLLATGAGGGNSGQASTGATVTVGTGMSGSMNATDCNNAPCNMPMDFSENLADHVKVIVDSNDPNSTPVWGPGVSDPAGSTFSATDFNVPAGTHTFYLFGSNDNGSTYMLLAQDTAVAQSGGGPPCVGDCSGGTYRLAVTVNGNGQVSDPIYGTCHTYDPQPCVANIPKNATISLTAAGVNGSTFTGWGGACAGAGNPCSGSMTQDYDVTANFSGGVPPTPTPTPGPGDSATASCTVNVQSAPVPNDPTNVSVTEPDYCVSGLGAIISWSYSDPQGSPQGGYEVQVSNTGNFNNPMYDSGHLNSSTHSFAIPAGVLDFNTTYKARVKVWNSLGGASGWSSSSNSWKTPSYAYPQVAFTWAPNSPGQNSPVQFADQTVFGGGNSNSRQWSWNFGDGGTSTTQSPTHAYIDIGSYIVTETATDAANQSCTVAHTVNVQKPIPIIREVAPK